jgi:hypothetical protein
MQHHLVPCCEIQQSGNLASGIGFKLAAGFVGRTWRGNQSYNPHLTRIKILNLLSSTEIVEGSAYRIKGFAVFEEPLGESYPYCLDGESIAFRKAHKRKRVPLDVSS